MEVIVVLVIIAISIAAGFLIAFIWATKNGQFDDTYSSSVRILIENKRKENEVQDDATLN